MKIYSFKLFIIAVVCVVIHVYWCNSVAVWGYIFSADNALLVGKNLFNTVVFVLFGAFVLALLFSVNILLARAVITVLNFIACIYTYYVFHFGIQMSDEVMMSMLFYPESNDIISSYDWTIFIYVPLLFLVSHFAISYVLKKFGIQTNFYFNPKDIIKMLFRNIALVLMSLVLFAVFLGVLYATMDATLLVYRIRTVAEQLMPSYLMARKANITKLAHAHSLGIELEGYEKYDFQYKVKIEKDPLIVVLIIGESLRSDRLGINGYQRKTTEHMQEIPNLYSFKNVLSCSTTTAVSLPCMLTNESQEDWIERFSGGTYTPNYSVAKVFTDTGFDTKWISAANKDYGMYIHKDFHGSISVMLSNDLRRKYISAESDFGDRLLVKAMSVDVKKDTLFVLGTMGSHRDYYSRYPKHMAVFKPDIGKSLEKIGNAYDNTVVYFDQFIFELTNKLKDKNAFLLYMSDHGESLGENGIFLHGAKVETAPKEQRLVPMIVWMSDKYIQLNPDKQKNILNWLEKNNNGKIQVKHDYLFHSLLDCAGIESKKGGVNHSLSVCSKPKN